MPIQVLRYSEAFKLQVVGEIERGRFRSVGEASRVYGICGKETVKRWVRKYGRSDLLNKVVRVEKAEEPEKRKQMKKRIRELEAALADAVMDGALNKAFFEQLCKDQGIDPESYKKKDAGQSFEKPEKKSEGREE